MLSLALLVVSRGPSSRLNEQRRREIEREREREQDASEAGPVFSTDIIAANGSCNAQISSIPFRQRSSDYYARLTRRRATLAQIRNSANLKP
jgi:hypothetical protein